MGQIVTPNRYFFMNAFPALMPESLPSADDYKVLEGMFNNGGSPSKLDLQKLFPHAFRRVREWSVEGIREYWWWRHRDLIDKCLEEYQRSSEPFRIQCKVRPAVLKSSSGSGIVEVRFKEEKDFQKVLLPSYLSDLSEGKYVTSHLRRIVEEITEEDYNEF